VLAARSEGMPKDNIQRAIDTSQGGDMASYEDVRYEGFGPGGVSLIIETLTDNRNRTATNVRTIVAKNGGNLGASGSVSHGFERLGLITYAAKAGNADNVFEAALDAGANDVQSGEDGHEIWTSVEALHEVSKALEPVLGEAESAKLAWKPGIMVGVGADDAAQLLKLIDSLEDDDDVQTVWGNYDVPEDVLAAL
jgi:YebC/PmpR family DNA-binding regulatory protein